MKIDSNKTLVLLVVFLLGSLTVKSQNASLKVTNGILYTVDGKWGGGDRLHYSTGKGFNYRASVDIAPGEHVIEYYLMKVKKVYSISFTAKPDKKYFVFNENDKPVVKEDKDVLTSAIIENVSAESGKDGYQVIPGIDDTLNVAYLKWDDKDEYFLKYNNPNFELRKIDQYWGDGSTGYISGMYNSIGDGFKVILTPGEHTLAAFLSFGSNGSGYISKKITEFEVEFESGKVYTIVFDNFGVDIKKRIKEEQVILILNSAQIVEVKE